MQGSGCFALSLVGKAAQRGAEDQDRKETHVVLAELCDDLRKIQKLAAERGETDILALVDHALAEVEPEQLLTTTEVAKLLGIKSVNTVKVLARAQGLRTVQHGNRMMIPLSEIERVRTSQQVRRVQVAERIHDATADLGGDLTQDDMDALEEARPGRLPWEAERPATGTRRAV